MSVGAEDKEFSHVLYITLALIGLLAICVFVIAGLVSVLAKRRRDSREGDQPELFKTRFHLKPL